MHNRRNYTQQAADWIRHAPENALRFFTNDPIRRVPLAVGAALGAYWGDSIPEKALMAAGLGALANYATDHFDYVRSHPGEAIGTAVGLLIGHYAGDFLDESTRGAMYHLGWADTIGTATGGIVGNLLERALDWRNRRNP